MFMKCLYLLREVKVICVLDLFRALPLAYEEVCFSLCHHYRGDKLSFKCSLGRYMDKYARLMQIMQPIATDVFKVYY